MKTKLEKRRQKNENETGEKLYEHNIEKDKILDFIQKIKLELSRIYKNGKSKLNLIKQVIKKGLILNTTK